MQMASTLRGSWAVALLPTLFGCPSPGKAPGFDTDSGGESVDSGVPEAVDSDGDGYAEGEDCNDEDAQIHPAADELCDGVDNDCDGVIDDAFADTDADGEADCIDTCPRHVSAGATGGTGTPEAPLATIGDAMSEASDGCVEIVVGAGTYRESLQFGAAAWRLTGATGPEHVVLEPPEGERGVLIMGVGTSDAPALLESLTIRGGSGAPIEGVSTEDVGGGVAVYNAVVDLRNVWLEDNEAHTGAGAYLRNWNGAFEGGTVRDNVAEKKGGGIMVNEGSAGVIQDSVFEGNQATTGSADGGALFLGTDTTTLVQRNRFAGNFAEGSGAAIRSMDGAATIINNIFVDNWVSASRYDAVYFSYDDAGLFANNTLVGNGLAFGQPMDDTVHEITTRIINNLIFEAPGAELVGDRTGLPGIFTNNLVYGEDGPIVEGATDPTGTDGNLSVPPEMVDVEAGDYCLQKGAPALDAGADLTADGVSSDFFGTARPLGSGFDIGACESG